MAEYCAAVLTVLFRHTRVVRAVGEIALLDIVRYPLHQLGAGRSESNEEKPKEEASNHANGYYQGPAWIAIMRS